MFTSLKQSHCERVSLRQLCFLFFTLFTFCLLLPIYVYLIHCLGLDFLAMYCALYSSVHVESELAVLICRILLLEIFYLDNKQFGVSKAFCVM
jgi:integral membrane sensor domain MASE1